MPFHPPSGAFWGASPTEDASAPIEETTEQDAAVAASEEYLHLHGPEPPPTKKPRTATDSASSSSTDTLNWDNLRITGLQLPVVASGAPAAEETEPGALDESASEALRNWYVHKLVSPKGPKTLELEAAARAEVVRCSLLF